MQVERITNLEDELATALGQIDNMEHFIERACIKSVDGLPIDEPVKVVYLADHDEANCPSTDCPDRINGTHLL